MKLLKAPPVRLLGKTTGTWWDLRDGKTHGMVYLYLAEGIRSGQWVISVKVHRNDKKAVVKVAGSEQASWGHGQFWGDRKSHDFEETRDKKHLYHQIGIGYVGTDRWERRRVRSKRQVVKKAVPKTLLRYFGSLMKPHDVISPKTGWSKRNNPMAKSLVVTVPKDRPDLMAWSYVLEKLQPLFRDRFVEPTRISMSFYA